MYYTILEFSSGQIFLAKSDKGLVAAWFLKNKECLSEALKSFEKKRILLEPDDTQFRLERKLFDRYFKGKKEDFASVPVDLILGSACQRKVWLEARKIPYGETRSYKYLAHKLNHKGYRSIGQAMSKNPLLIIIPCHRVVASDGSLGGFSAGIELKRFLLNLEKEGLTA